MIMKRIYILLTACLAIAACKRVDVNFTYSPTDPRAGRSVQFTNNSSSGEEWEWTFGDGSTSTLKSPTHTYKKPGTYAVRLVVDQKKNLTASATLTVLDTVPSFGASDSVFTIYEDYTFTAQVYNPYNLKVSYLWSLPDGGSNAVVTDTAMTGSMLTLYFTRPSEGALINLRVILNSDTTYIGRGFAVSGRATHSVLLRTTEGDYRQRIFGQRADVPEEDASAATLLNSEQDTIQEYNGVEFRLSNLQYLEPEMQGFHIANRKLYFRDNEGLWVANIDGVSFPVPIDTSAFCYAMTLDKTDSRIYWSNGKGVWYMPFVGSDNNRFVTTPALLNPMDNVLLIATDPEKK